MSNNSNISPSFPLVSHPHNQAHHYLNESEQQNSAIGPQENYNSQYYEQFKKLFLTSYCLSVQLKKVAKTKDQICAKLTKLQKKIQEECKQQSKVPNPDRKKRVRRTAQQIVRKYVCTVQRCERNYGSEGSLQQHIKLKHPQLYAQKLRQGGYVDQSNFSQSLQEESL